MSLHELSDRELCLRLAAALGWEWRPGHAAPGFIECPPAGSRDIAPVEWLVTDAGAVAVLAAMRERRFEIVVRVEIEACRTSVYRHNSSRDLGYGVSSVIARAIAEAACAALGAS